MILHYVLFVIYFILFQLTFKLSVSCMKLDINPERILLLFWIPVEKQQILT